MSTRSRFHHVMAFTVLALGLAGCNQAPPAPASAPPPATPPLQVLAAGNAASPPSLTAVTNDNRVLIDSVQPLHPGARPNFQGLKLAQPGEQAADMLLGWQRNGGEVVLVPQGAAGAGPDRRKVRVVNTPAFSVGNDDQVLVFMTSTVLNLPDAAQQAVDGRVLSLLVLGSGTAVRVQGLGGGNLQLASGRSAQLIALKDLGRWEVLARN